MMYFSRRFYLTSSFLQDLCVQHRFFNLLENTNFTGDGNRELLIGQPDCEQERTCHRGKKKWTTLMLNDFISKNIYSFSPAAPTRLVRTLRSVLQNRKWTVNVVTFWFIIIERNISRRWCGACTSFCNHLRTAQVEVDGVAVVLSEQGGLHEHFRIVGTKLTQKQENCGSHPTYGSKVTPLKPHSLSCSSCSSPGLLEVCLHYKPRCKGFLACSWRHGRTPGRAAWECSRDGRHVCG